VRQRDAKSCARDCLSTRRRAWREGEGLDGEADMAQVNDENGGAKQNEAIALGVLARGVKPEPAWGAVNLGTPAEYSGNGKENKQASSTGASAASDGETTPKTPAAVAAMAAAEIAIAVGAMNDARSGVERKAGRRWTQHEDTVLRELVEKNGNRHWKRIAKEFAERSGSERSDVQCLHRWNKCLKPGLLKGPWTAKEDETIKKMIEEHGGHQNIRWSVIAKVLKGRLGKQVRERWINHLDPSINKGEWKEEEDDSLYELQKRFGNRWKWIAELMPGRSENGVKNRWHSIKQHLLNRKELEGRTDQSSKGLVQKNAAVMSQATKTATAAAVAAALADKSKLKRATVKSETGAAKRANKKRKVASPTLSDSTNKSATLSDLLSIGKSLGSGISGSESMLQAASASATESSSKTRAGAGAASASTFENEGVSSLDLSAVAERAQELLRMSESYREMARVMLDSQSTTKPNSSQHNANLSKEITSQILKQLGQGARNSEQLTQLKSPDEKDITSAPLSTDPVLFNNYFNVFNNSAKLGGAVQTPCRSPTHILAAAAAMSQPCAKPSDETTPGKKNAVI